MMTKLGMDDTTPIQSKMVSRSVESAQKRVEGNNFDARKRLLQYDDVLRLQREIIYKERNEILESENIRGVLENMLSNVIANAVAIHTTEEKESDWNLKGLEDFLGANVLPDGRITIAAMEGKSVEELTSLIQEAATERYDEKEAEMSEERMREF